MAVQRFALTFDGQNDKVDVPFAAGLNPTQQFTFHAWAKVSGGKGYRSVVTSRDDYPQRGYIFYATPQNRWQFWVGTGSGWSGLQGAAVKNNSWTHLVGCYDGVSRTMTFYVNGEAFTKQNVAFSPNTRQPLRIGAGASESAGGNYFFPGQVAEVGVWKRVLTKSEVNAYRERPLEGDESGLVGYWPLNEGEGQIVKGYAGAPAGSVLNGGVWRPVTDHPITRKAANWALRFDGQNDHATANSFSWPSGGPVTVEFWAMVGARAVRNSSVFTVGGQDNPNRFHAHLPWGNRRLYWDYGKWNGTGRVHVDYSPYLGKWTHVALVSEGNGGRFMGIYLNGELKASTKRSDGPNVVLNGLTLGRWNKLVHKGKLAEFRLWSRVRSEAEIRAQMYNRLTGQEEGLAGYWRLDEGFGKGLQDLSPHGNHGVIQEAKWVTPGNLPTLGDPVGLKLSNAALKLDGAGDFVALAAASELSLTNHDFTAEAWIHVTAYVGGDESIFGTDETSKGHGLHLVLRNQKPYMGFYGNDLTGQTTIETGRWYHIAFRYTAETGEQAIFVNGKLDASASGRDPFWGIGMVRIGRWAGGRYFNGMIKEARIWGTAQSNAEIAGYMGHTLTGKESGLVGYWPLDDGEGNIARNVANKGQFGTLVNALWDTAGEFTLEAPLTKPVSDVPDEENVLVDIDFSALPEPFQTLATDLQEAINSEVGAAKGDIELTSDLLGPFDLFGSVFGLPTFEVLEIKEAELQIVGEAGVDLTSGEAAGKIGLKLSGTSSAFGQDLVTTVCLFYLDSAGQPSALAKLTPPSEGVTWGIGTAFPDVPVIKALGFSNPAIVLSTEDTEDEELAFGIAEGFNFFGDVPVGSSEEKMIAFIGGIFGVENLGTHAAVMKTNLGPKYILEAAVEQEVTVIPSDIFNLKFMGSEIGLEVIGGEPSVSIANNMLISMKWVGVENLYFTGMVKAEPESITGSFTLNKAGSGGQEWREPFGIPGIIIRNLAVQVGMTYIAPWIDNVGIAGDMKIGTVDGKMAVLVDTNDPDQFVLYGQTDEITLLEIMSAMSPPTFAAYQLIPSGVRAAMEKVVDVKLTGIDEEGVLISIVPVATKIGALAFNDEGITLKGKLVAWGWGAQAHINVSDSNILVDARMDAINIANVFKVTGAGSDRNPQLYFNVSTSADPQLYVSGKIQLLNVSRELLIQATTQGLEFKLTEKVGNILTTNLTCVLGDNNFAASGYINFTLNLSVGPIRIAGVKVADRIRLVDVGFNANASMQASTAPSFHMSISGSFRFYGANLSMPTLTLNVAPADFEAVFDAVQQQILDNASRIFASLFNSGLEWAQNIGKAGIEFAGDAAKVLKDAFKESAEQTAKIMKNTLGKGANEVAKGLEDAYNLSSKAAASVLRDAGYGINQIGNAVEDAYNLSAEGVAEALKGAGYAANEVGDFMKDAGKWGENAINDALKGAGYAAGEVEKFMGDVFGGKWIPHVDVPYVDIIPHVDHVDISKY